MQNQAKAKKVDHAISEIGQFNFVTKEKRFGYSVQPKNKGNELGDNELDLEKLADAGRQPTKTKGGKDLNITSKWKSQRIGVGISDGWTPSGVHPSISRKSTPTVLNKGHLKKVADAPEGRGGVYVPPGRRRTEAKSSIGSSKAAGLGSSVQSRPPPGAVGKSFSLPTKRKLTFDNKGKGKVIQESRPVVKKWGLPAKGIIFQEPGSMEARPLSSSSSIPWKTRSKPYSSALAGPSKVGEWLGSDAAGLKPLAEEEILCIGLDRKTHSLELIRNLYQAEEDEEKDEISPILPVAAASVPVQIQSSNSESVNEALQEASLEDIGWLRPVIGRWADVVDSDEEDQYAEQALAEKEELDVPRDESGEEESSDEDEPTMEDS